MPKSMASWWISIDSLSFLGLLKDGLERWGFGRAWPTFIVTQVGTDLHTTYFDAQAARRLYETVMPMKCLIKGHYTDWVENPADYPATGMGGANVGPEFTPEEYLALKDLEAKERALCRYRHGFKPSRFMDALQAAAVDSGRWEKWLQPDERGLDFAALSTPRQDWLLQSGARYIWTTTAVVEARRRLYSNISSILPDPHQYVVDRIARVIDKYIIQFNLFDSLSRFTGIILIGLSFIMVALIISNHKRCHPVTLRSLLP